MEIIQTQELSKRYGFLLSKQTDGLKKLNLEIKEREIFGFLGPNGAGKTTTMRLLLSLIYPTNGSAQIFAKNITNNPQKLRQEIGYLPGEINLPADWTGQDCLKYYRAFKPKRVDDEYLNDLIQKLDLDTSPKIRNYSKGNKQKLALVLAFMHKPKLLILDEPTSGLDPLIQEVFYDLALNARKDGASIFLSTHILNEAEKLCDRVGILKEGTLLAIENIDDFRNKHIRKITLYTPDRLDENTAMNWPGVTKTEPFELGYYIFINTKVGEILEKLRPYKINDLEITEPSLEELFLHYYQS
jgi:ABC-2 type transport system ATP-binding protein